MKKRNEANKCKGMTMTEAERWLDLGMKELKHTISQSEQAELDALNKSYPSADIKALSALTLLVRTLTGAVDTKVASDCQSQEPKSDESNSSVYSDAVQRAADFRKVKPTNYTVGSVVELKVRSAVQDYLKELDNKSVIFDRLNKLRTLTPESNVSTTEIASLKATTSCGEDITLFIVTAVCANGKQGIKVNVGPTDIAIASNNYSEVPLLLVYTDDDYATMLSTFRTWLVDYVARLL
jgi:hypothetical protein